MRDYDEKQRENRQTRAFWYATGRFDAGTGFPGSSRFAQHYADACEATDDWLPLRPTYDTWAEAQRTDDQVRQDRALEYATSMKETTHDDD